MLIISIFQSSLMCAVFQGIGKERIWDYEDLKKFKFRKVKKLGEARKYVAHNEQVSKDYNGFVFFCATDQFLSIAVSQVLQMPELTNIYVREMQNKMYSPSAFFLAKWFVTTIMYMFQPIIYSLFIFQYIGFEDNSNENFYRWVKIAS